MQDKIVALPSRKRAAPGYPSTYNVPIPLTPLIGREREVAAASDLLKRPEVRLVTLTGPGGVGKTHLGVQVASDLLDHFSGGVCFVPLASISDPHLVVPTIARELGLKEAQDQSVLDLVNSYLRPRHLLLLLDNFEQVAAAAPRLADLLAACPHLKALVTSRAVLHIRGEYQFPVPPLDLPDLKQVGSGDTLTQYASVALFLERARAVRPDFQITAATARIVAEICVRLDGLPLAIELAAARTKLLSPHKLLERLEHRLPVLTGGTQDMLERQQTLSATIEWSYRLLDAREQQLFRRFSVFVGGATMQAVEAILSAFNEEESEALEIVASLIDKSLLQSIDQGGDEPRLSMLETIREYALERLAASAETEKTRQAHALYYLRLSEDAAQEIHGPQQAVWLESLEREHDNLRAALRWSLEEANDAQAGTARPHLETALRLSQALIGFWQIHGHYSEGRSILEQVLAASEGMKSPLRAKALTNAAMLVNIHGDTERAAVLAEESLALYRELGDQEGIALALYQLGHVAWLKSDFARARSLLEETLEISKALGDAVSVAYAFYSLGGLASIRGEYARGIALFEEALALFKSVGNKRGVALSLLQLAELHFISQGDMARIGPLLEEGLALCREIGDKDGLALGDYYAGQVALSQGDVATAGALLDESLALYRELSDPQRIARSLIAVAKLETLQSNYTAARAHFEESLSLSRVGHMFNIISGLEGLAQLAAAQGTDDSSREQALWAARLWGAAEALRDKLDAPLPPVERQEYQRSIDAARRRLGGEAFTAAWAVGRSMSPEQALSRSASAAEGQAAGVKALPRPAAPDGLTAREVEVLQLVAQGLTDAQIAEKLVITRRTVNWYLTSIYSKIHVSSRAAATRYALEHRLV